MLLDEAVGTCRLETLIQSLSISFLDFIQSEESSDANSKLFKEDDDEAMYKNPCEIRLCD